jgi:hypothetical protein
MESPRKARQVKGNVESILIICFDIKGTIHNEFFLVGENVQRLRPELWRQKNWLLHHDNAPFDTSFFTRDFL